MKRIERINKGIGYEVFEVLRK